MIQRFIGFFLGAISAGIIAVLWYLNFVSIPPILTRLELQTIDYRMQFSRQPDASKAIKIVLVNDMTNLSDKLAKFIKLVSTAEGGKYKPKVIGLNYLFDVPTINEELVSVVSAFGNVFYGYYFQLTPPQTPVQGTNQDILPFRLEITPVGDVIQKVLEAQDAQLPAPKYLTTARGIGFVNTLADIDNVCRRIPLFLRYQGNWYGSLALWIAIEYLGIDSVDITFYPGQYLEIVQEDGSFMKIPVNRYGQMLVDFAYDSVAGAVAPFETFSMENDILPLADLIDQIPASSPLAALKDAVVLVGSGSQPSSALQPIPLAKSYPLIGIHANVINNLLNNHFARELRLSFTIGLMLILSMLTGLLMVGHHVWTKLFLGVLMAVLYLGIAYGVFFQFRILLPVLPALFSLGLTLCTVAVLVRYKRTTPKVRPQPQPQQSSQDKKRKTKTAPDVLDNLEKDLVVIREELDRKSFRLRSKIEELRDLQERIESNTSSYSDTSGQVASLQKEIRAREIEIKSLVMKEEEMRRQMENLPFTDANVQLKANPEKLEQLFAKHGFITHDETVLYALQRAEKLGKTAVTLLIHGEPGTGKHLLAHIIRELSTRQNRPVLDVLCGGDMDLLEDDLFGHKKGAFPGAEEPRNGYFKDIDGGTLVIEDIDQLSLEVQTRLIQTLRGKVVRPVGEDRGYPIDVRVIATTSQDLNALVSAGKFREDLYHYFSVFPVFLPPLRDRKEDIPALATYFVQKYDRTHSKIVETLSDEAINVLITHQWPGNIVELEKVIERAIAEINPGVKELTEKDISFEEVTLTGGIKDHGMLNALINLMDTNKKLPSYPQFREKVLVEIQRLYCARLLRLHNGNVKSAAVDTGLKEETFKKMLTELMIDPEHYRI